MKIKVIKGGANLFEKTLVFGWNYIGAGMGVHLFERTQEAGTLRISNGVHNGQSAGTVFFDKIEVEFDEVVHFHERFHVNGSGTKKIMIGSANECFPVRAVFELDFSTSPNTIYPASLPANAGIYLGRLHVKFPQASLNHNSYGDGWVNQLKTGQRNGHGRLIEAPQGIWDYLYMAQCYEPGGWGIRPIEGWANPLTSFLTARLTMQRTPIDCLDAATGEPIANPGFFQGSGYSLVRGPYKSTNLPRFHQPASSDQYDNRVTPKLFNEGTCPYFAKMHGQSRDGDVNAPDDQHLIRILGPLRALAQIYNDPCAEFDLKMLAQDTQYARPIPGPVAPGKGSSWIGTRGWAWSTLALLSSPATRTLGILYARQATQAQMRNGQIMRARADYGPNGQYNGFVPSPWLAYGGNPLPANHDASKLAEAWFSMVTLVEAGEHEAARKIASGVLLPRRGGLPSVAKANGGNNPDYVGVADTGNGPVHPQIMTWFTMVGYFRWIPVGLMALLEQAQGRDPRPWLEACYLMSGPATSWRAQNLAELKAKVGIDGFDETVMMAAAIEQL